MGGWCQAFSRAAFVLGTTMMMVVVLVAKSAVGQRVQFFDTLREVQEGEEFSVRVHMIGSVSEEVRIIVEINDLGDDFIGDTQVATFSPSIREAMVKFTARDDDKPENRERFDMNLVILTEISGPDVYLGQPSTATVYIEASDDGFGVFGLLQDSPVMVREEDYDSTVSLTVQRTVSYFGTIKVTFVVESLSDSGKLGWDISPTTSQITFLPGQREAPLQLTIKKDDVPENSEPFMVRLTTTDHIARIDRSEVMVIIQANDALVRFSQAEYLYDEGPGSQTHYIEVYRGIDNGGHITGSLDTRVTVGYKFNDGTARKLNDYTATDGELIFETNETVKTIPFVIEEDTDPEIRESFEIRLWNLQGDAVFQTRSVAHIFISSNDDSHGKITFEPASEGSVVAPVVRVNEDTYTVARIPVLREGGTFGEVSVGWRLERPESLLVSASDDVGPTAGVLEFGEGDNRRDIELMVVQDSEAEPTELFEVTLQHHQVTGNATLGGITTALLIIEDSDNVYGTVEFGPDTSNRIEIESAPRALKLSVTRNGGRHDTVLVNVNVSYVDNGVEALPENIFEEWMLAVRLPEGQDPIIVTVPILTEAFLTIGGKFEAFMDQPHLESEPTYGNYNSPTLGFRHHIFVPVSPAEANGESGFNSTAPFFVEEPDSGIVEVPLLIVREGMSGRASITWSISGVGPSADYVDSTDVEALTGTINIESGFSSVDLVVKIQADDIPEIDETMVVRLERIEPYLTQRLRPGSMEIEITVLKNDNPGGSFQFASSMSDSYTIEEGNEPIMVTVERVGGNLETKSVQINVEPSGSEEFYGAPTALEFRPGESVRTTTILARNDGEPELSESFTLVLSPLGNSTLGERIRIVINVVESDFPYGVIQFAEDSTIIFTDEDVDDVAANVSLVVLREQGTFFEVQVPWKLAPETGEDLQPSSGVIVFAPGQSSYTLVLQTVNDQIPEGDETYAVELKQPIGGAVPGIRMVATVTITENDNPVVFTDNLVYIEEPGSHVFTVRRLGRLDTAVSVAYRTLDGSASSLQGDYQEIFHETLLFDADEASKTLMVTILDDSTPEGNETFMLELFDATGNLLITDNSRSTVVILANDDAYGVFSLEIPANDKVEEGSTIYYHIIRDQGIFGEVEVGWEIRTQENLPVAQGAEFEVSTGTMVFQPQESRRALGITPLADQLPEGQEIFRLVLTSVTVVTGLVGRGLVRLADHSLQMDIVVLASDDPNGRFAFPAFSQELSVAEDFYPGDEGSASTSFTVERRQGTQGLVQVLWEVFSEPFGTSLPAVFDLLFLGDTPSSVSSVPDKQRQGTGTTVYLLSGAEGSYITVPPSLAPTASDFTGGFTISAWVQPYQDCDGYIVTHGSADGVELYYGLRLVATAASTTFLLTLSSELPEANETLSVSSGMVTQDGQWHHVLVSVGNSSLQVYLDGTVLHSSALDNGVPIVGAGALLVGARAPGNDLFVGYMQDVRIWARAFDSSEANALYRMPPLNDVTPISGVLTYDTGVRTQGFSVGSVQDIEEEGGEVFSIFLLASTGGATLSIADSQTTLTVLKSDNANGLFGFREPCTPVRVEDESAKVSCNVLRRRGDDGSVNVTWLVEQRTATGMTSAVDDFDAVTGMLLFLRGERLKTFEVQVKEETIPELDELFEVRLVSAISSDGVVGSTNTSGASVDRAMRSSEVTIVENDYPFGLFQFGREPGVPPTPDENGRIQPVEDVPTVRIGEEGGMVALVVERAQGHLGSVSVEWRTVDRTALSEGKIPPDYVVNGAAGRVDFVTGQLYSLVNITVRDNAVPEGEKSFMVELVNPTGGSAVGPGGSVEVVINASDHAYGVYQFHDSSLHIQAQETGDAGYTSVFFKVVRLGGSIGADTVSWQAFEDEDDGPDLVERSGTVEFEAGQSEADLEVKVSGDTEPELDEIFTVKLIRVEKGELGDALKCSSTVTIAANDDPYGYFVISDQQRPITVQEEARGQTTDHVYLSFNKKTN